ncbi:hypothetical protein COOONC_15892 [Cooperia oncophora]
MSGIGGHIENFESHRVRVKISTAFGEGLEFEFQTKPGKDICLANSKLRGEHLTPLVLVGLDYYHELVESYASGTKTPSGLYISKTIFGPVIYGKGEIPPQHMETKKDVAYGLTAIFEQAKEGMVQNQQPNPSRHLPRPCQKIGGHFIVKQKAVPRGNPQHGKVKEVEKLKNTSIRLKGSNLNHRIFHSPLKKPWATVKSRPSNQTRCKTGQLEQQRAFSIRSRGKWCEGGPSPSTFLETVSSEIKGLKEKIGVICANNNDRKRKWRLHTQMTHPLSAAPKLLR